MTYKISTRTGGISCCKRSLQQAGEAGRTDLHLGSAPCRAVSAEAEAAATEVKNLLHKFLLQNRENSEKGRNPATHHRGLTVPYLQLSPPVTLQQAEHLLMALGLMGFDLHEFICSCRNHLELKSDLKTPMPNS